MPKFQYAYAAPASVAIYPILGSLVRALGKGWRVLVVAPAEQLTLFAALLNSLTQSDQLVTLTVEALAVGKMTSDFELVLSLYAEAAPNEIIRTYCQIPERSHLMTVEGQPATGTYDLISYFDKKTLSQQGVYAITGTGKGKTTTALGLAAEAFLQGGKVAVIQWFKEKQTGALTWAINEHIFPSLLKSPQLRDRFTFYPTGAGFVGSPNMDRVAEQAEHVAKAQAGLALAQTLIESGEYALVVLDEFVDTLTQVMTYLPYPLLEVAEVQHLLGSAQKSPTQVIVTGRQVTPEWERYIGQSLVIAEVKHPWSDKHQGAVSGLDF